MIYKNITKKGKKAPDLILRSPRNGSPLSEFFFQRNPTNNMGNIQHTTTNQTHGKKLLAIYSHSIWCMNVFATPLCTPKTINIIFSYTYFYVFVVVVLLSLFFFSMSFFMLLFCMFFFVFVVIFVSMLWSISHITPKRYIDFVLLSLCFRLG